MVIDKQTGQTPPTAAERMAVHDRKMGVEPTRPAAAPRAETEQSARPAPTAQKTAPPAATAKRSKQPWSQPPTDRPVMKSEAAPARIPGRAAPQAGGTRKTIVTGNWWDAKGPRTIELGPQGQAELTGGLLTLFFAIVIAAIIALFIEPLLLFVTALLLFQFGGKILGPMGARLIDKALAEKG